MTEAETTEAETGMMKPQSKEGKDCWEKKARKESSLETSFLTASFWAPWLQNYENNFVVLRH